MTNEPYARRAKPRLDKGDGLSNSNGDSKTGRPVYKGGVKLPWVAWVGSFVVLSTVWPLWHHQIYHCWNVWAVSLTFFSSVNILISLWEIALWRYIDEIEMMYHELRAKYGDDRVRAGMDLFVSWVDVRDALSLRYWAIIWSVYSLWDPSYSDKRSYGFFIDIGNGHTMLIPSILWIVNSLVQWPLPPQFLGLVGLISFYQMFYGCALYFVSFFTNKRHQGKSFAEIFGFVGVSNGIWTLFPLMGCYVSIRMILEDSFACVLCT